MILLQDIESECRRMFTQCDDFVFAHGAVVGYTAKLRLDEAIDNCRVQDVDNSFVLVWLMKMRFGTPYHHQFVLSKGHEPTAVMVMGESVYDG